jgi:asparagine synthase (glutamine-hydrolysing)
MTLIVASLGGARSEALGANARFEPHGANVPTRSAGEWTEAVDGPLIVSTSGLLARDAEGGMCALDGVVDTLDRLRSDLRYDAEPAALLLKGWRAWGEGLLDRLDGEFAFVVGHGQRLLAARDRIGARALFWTVVGGRLHLATEVEPLLGIMPTVPAPDLRAMTLWVSSEEAIEGRTLYSGVRKLRPAHLLRAHVGSTVERRYWRPAYRGTERVSADEAAERVANVITETIQARVPSGARAALMLSGGVDSTTVAGLAGSRAVGAYSASFPTWPGIDETELVDEVVAALGLRGARVEVGAEGLLAGAVRHIARWKLPPLGWNDFFEHPLLRVAAEDGATVVLTGDGGDEMFGVRGLLLADRLRSGRPLAGWRLLHQVPGAGDHPPLRALLSWGWDNGIRGALPAGLHAAMRRVVPARRPFWLRAEAAQTIEGTLWAWQHHDGPRWWAFLARHVTEGYDGLGLFDHLRRRAAWAGLEDRQVLLAPAVVKLALSLPPELFFDPYLNRMPLRSAVQGRLPDRVRLRPDKAIFNAMVTDNLLGELPAIAGVLHNLSPELADVADPAAVRRLLRDGPEAHPVHPFIWTQQVLRLVTTEIWLRELATPGYADAAVDRGMFRDPLLPVRRLGS